MKEIVIDLTAIDWIWSAANKGQWFLSMAIFLKKNTYFFEYKYHSHKTGKVRNL